MIEKKKYNLAYNSVETAVIVCSTPQDAERSGSWWKVVEAYNLHDAKQEFIKEYREAHSETE
ncbi:MAG: hypothetical protein RLZZ196_1818 [Bacteroidota bacterium]|jgi:hypothetical protein